MKWAFAKPCIRLRTIFSPKCSIVSHYTASLQLLPRVHLAFVHLYNHNLYYHIQFSNRTSCNDFGCVHYSSWNYHNNETLEFGSASLRMFQGTVEKTFRRFQTMLMLLRGSLIMQSYKIVLAYSQCLMCIHYTMMFARVIRSEWALTQTMWVVSIRKMLEPEKFNLLSQSICENRNLGHDIRKSLVIQFTIDDDNQRVKNNIFLLRNDILYRQSAFDLSPIIEDKT